MRKRPVPEILKDIKKLHGIGLKMTQLAEILGVSVSTIDEWKKKGEMPAIYYEKLQEIINKKIFGIPSHASEDLIFRHDDDDE
jgi:DNA-binding transcriptional regulator YiaG